MIGLLVDQAASGDADAPPNNRDARVPIASPLKRLCGPWTTRRRIDRPVVLDQARLTGLFLGGVQTSVCRRLVGEAR